MSRSRRLNSIVRKADRAISPDKDLDLLEDEEDDPGIYFDADEV